MSLVEQLQQGCREIEMPARLTLAGGETLECVQILRLLPGKHAVLKARRRGRTVLLKLLPNTASGRRNRRRELAGYRALNNAQINTPELLFDMDCAGGGYALGFEFLHGARTLGELGRDCDRNRLDAAACGLNVMSQLLKRGCAHADPHLDNFLRAGEQVYVVDAGAITPKRNSHYGAWQQKNLALFLAHFPPLLRQELLASLAADYPEAANDPALEGAIAAAWRRRKSRYLKKCFRECSEFATRRNWRRVAVWRRAEQSDALASFLRNPDDWIAKGERIKDGGSATVVRVSLGERRVVIRRNNIKHIGHGLQRCLRATRSHVNWRNAHLLRFNGIATPEPIAFVENRWGFFRRCGYYVCAFDESPSAEKKYQSQPPNEQDLLRFSTLFASLRLARLYHGDLKASNLLVTDEGISLIDLDSMKECRSKTNARAWLQKDQRRFLENWKDRAEQLALFAGVFRTR